MTDRFHETGRLLRYAHSTFSQGGEDGILQEIFDRIGSGGRRFVEFGVGDGRVTNTIGLLHDGWSGVWLESSEAHAQVARENYADRNVRIVTATVTTENVARLISKAGPLDLLSIDVDGNDYWLWKAIDSRPRVVVIEYNAMWPPGQSKTVKYDPDRKWDATNYFGASISALERLGWDKGYRLVGCSPAGVNAFFVQSELIDDHFSAPFTADNHYEPARYALAEWSGYLPGLGEWVSV